MFQRTPCAQQTRKTKSENAHDAAALTDDAASLTDDAASRERSQMMPHHSSLREPSRHARTKREGFRVSGLRLTNNATLFLAGTQKSGDICIHILVLQQPLVADVVRDVWPVECGQKHLHTTSTIYACMWECMHECVCGRGAGNTVRKKTCCIAARNVGPAGD